jgi:hypothetical protein
MSRKNNASNDKSKADPSFIPEWHKQQELILKRWSEIGSSYRYLHDKAFHKFNRQNLWFALPVIVISTITGTANFAQGSFPAAWKDYVPLGIGFLNLSAGLITTVSQFLRVSELLEGHRAASLAYSKFSRNISVELSLPVKERTSNGSEFLQSCRAELDRLVEQSPNIPEMIVNGFMKRFPEPEKDASGNLSNGYNFFRPEILDIKPITIYRDKEEEIKRAKEQAEKEALEKSEIRRKLDKKLLEDKKKEEDAIHKRIRAEFVEREKKMKDMIELTRIRTQTQLVESKFNSSGIEDSMETLLSSLKTNVDEVSSYSSDEESILGINSRTDMISPLSSPQPKRINIVIEETTETSQDTEETIETSQNTEETIETTDNSGNNLV